MINSVFMLDSVAAVQADENSLGGKAKNLAWLSRNGFPVPQWWVLTSESFSAQIVALAIRDWIQE